MGFKQRINQCFRSHDDYHASKKVPMATSRDLMDHQYPKQLQANCITEGVQTHKLVSVLTDWFKRKLRIITGTDQEREACVSSKVQRYSYSYSQNTTYSVSTFLAEVKQQGICDSKYNMGHDDLCNMRWWGDFWWNKNNVSSVQVSISAYSDVYKCIQWCSYWNVYI